MHYILICTIYSQANLEVLANFFYKHLKPYILVSPSRFLSYLCNHAQRCPHRFCAVGEFRESIVGVGRNITYIRLVSECKFIDDSICNNFEMALTISDEPITKGSVSFRYLPSLPTLGSLNDLHQQGKC